MKAGIEHRIGGIVLEEDKGILRSSNIPNKYELIIVASKEARRSTAAVTA